MRHYLNAVERKRYIRVATHPTNWSNIYQKICLLTHTFKSDKQDILPYTADCAIELFSDFNLKFKTLKKYAIIKQILLYVLYFDEINQIWLIYHPEVIP